MTLRLRSLSRKEVRQLDLQAADLALPALVLMENAGRGAASWLAELAGAMPPDAGGRIFSLPPELQKPDLQREPALPKALILCGPGNNGGDGAVVARHLDAWGFPVRVIWFAQRDDLQGDTAAQWAILEKSGVHQSSWFESRSTDTKREHLQLETSLADADWLVDGLLGTGLSRPVEGMLRSVIEAVNHSGKPVFALDLPSGLDADTGQPLGVAVRAKWPRQALLQRKRGSPLPMRLITLAKSPLSTLDYRVACSNLTFTGDESEIAVTRRRSLKQRYYLHDRLVPLMQSGIASGADLAILRVG